MKNFIWLFLALPLLSVSECGKKKNGTMADKPAAVKDSLPSCLRTMIDSLGKDIPSSQPLKAEEYSYKGRTVYLLTMDCCDQFNPVYDDSCRRLCAPTGGFTGRGDGQCPDFEKEAKLVRTVWTRPEKP